MSRTMSPWMKLSTTRPLASSPIAGAILSGPPASATIPIRGTEPVSRRATPGRQYDHHGGGPVALGNRSQLPDHLPGYAAGERAICQGFADDVIRGQLGGDEQRD